jgi:hypothetical protein
MSEPIKFHTGNFLKQYVKKNRIRQSGWARKAGLNVKTVSGYLKQPTMWIETLLGICLILNHNFFKDIAATLPPDMPPLTENPLQARIDELEAQNHDLQLQVKTLERALELVGK